MDTKAQSGGGTSTTRDVVRAESHGYRLREDVLESEFGRCHALRSTLLRYAQALLTRSAQSAVCKSHQSIEQQFCRVLLTAPDRLPGDELALTHEAIAQSLGVRRESVTNVAGNLQAAGIIRYHRGRMVVLERRELERRACECCAVVLAKSWRLVHPQHAVAARPTTIAGEVASRMALHAGD